jgi:hypothetical protein
MLNNLTNFFNLIVGRKIKNASTIEDTDLIPLGTRDPRYDGFYQPTGIEYSELKDNILASIPPPPVGGVESVTGGTANTIVQVNNADPLNPIIQINGVKYANVLFVDNTNPSPTPNVNRFDQPYSDVGSAMVSALGLTPTSINRTLIYVRRGQYGGNIILQNYTDWYCEPGVVFVNTGVYDNIQTVESRFLGKASFTGSGFSNWILRLQGPSTKAVFEFDEINCLRGAFITENGASVVINGRKVYSESIATACGSTFRGSGNIILNITEEFKAVHQTILFKFFSGKVVVNCPKLAMGSGNYFGGNFKQVIQCADGNNGGTCTINGNLVNEDAGGYYGGISGMIGRWTGSDNMTLTLNGNIIAGDYWAIYGLGSSAGSKTVINGNIITNHIVTYSQNASTIVFKNGVLINTNTQASALTYPVISVGVGSTIWVENCHMYSFGTGSTEISAFTKNSASCTLNVYNTVYSGADTTGFFVRDTTGAPGNNVRIHNCRSTKGLDVNIVDLLSPTGFIQDPNIVALNFF